MSDSNDSIMSPHDWLNQKVWSHLAGAWVGLELDEAQGKNDGVVRGYRYFSCPPNHGFSAQNTLKFEIAESRGVSWGFHPAFKLGSSKDMAKL